MTKIKYHAPRLPDEHDVYEVYFTSHSSRTETHDGSIFFKPLDIGFKEVACRMHGTREREEYLSSAAKRLIREKKEPVVYDADGNIVAELAVSERYDGDKQ
ncbi:hypothetical protein [Natrinema sp. DC36]|uniref:hypothetical protein n=1 Tax=Natrinema sp. DC36 TaxID=2878680 RepID=UPI001CEFFEB9|nr:hypothetical protein [Natrinema sp. DC36]